ncbi:MAG: 3'-5' exoribonuclease [Pirellulaceae bacterium]|jgi:3'-5' exoribonuclease
MTRRFISQLGEGESVDQVFLTLQKQTRSNRNGNLYLQLRLADRTGSVTGMLWNANEKVTEMFECGEYLRVQGTTQIYNGVLQMIVNRIDPVVQADVDPEDFVTVTEKEIETLTTRLREMLRGMKNFPLRNLADCFLMDEEFMRRFCKAPAGIKNHHAFHGGLLQHVINVMELAQDISPRYPEMDADLLLIGAFLHDVGKIEELGYEREFEYTDAGQLLGHLVIAQSMLDEKVAEAEKLSGETFPRELVLRIKHMILSHHGLYEYGSPKVPMTLEALALHYLDSLDSKMHTFTQLMAEDASGDSGWTNYHPSLGRKIFKGSANPEG